MDSIKFPRFPQKQYCEHCSVRLDIVQNKGCGASMGDKRTECNEKGWGYIAAKEKSQKAVDSNAA